MKLYVSKLLDEIRQRGTQSHTYKFVDILKKQVNGNNIILSSKFDVEV